jgi:hypothetical protein
MKHPWRLPDSLRQINDEEPGHQGPSCRSRAEYAEYQADRLWHAEQTPMRRGGQSRWSRSPHTGTHLFRPRYSRWPCTIVRPFTQTPTDRAA